MTGTTQGTVHVWDLAALSKRVFARHDGTVVDLGMSPDGMPLLTGSEDHSARLWNAKTGAPLGIDALCDSQVPRAAFAPDGLRYVTGTSGGAVTVLDARTGLQLAAFAGHDSGVTDANFSPDGLRAV